MKVLVINCGSSSLKYQLIDMSNETALAVGLVERIGIEGSILTQKVNGEKFIIQEPMEDHKKAIELVLKALIDPDNGVIKDMSEISSVGHRVVHGGEKYASSVLIDNDVMDVLEECVKLAPLHNPPNIIGINSCKELMPETPMVGVFDTAFHQTIPQESFMYAIPYELYEKHKIRGYGFHGTSHKFVSKEAADFLGKDINDLKIITCHLGNGASVAAVKNGQCVDTSMGFTPLAGLIMGTRCGDIDPAVVTFLINDLGMSAEEANTVLNKKSGVLGVSGISSDFRDLEGAASDGNERAQLALDMFHYRVKKYIGSYAAAMGGVDCIVFTGGIGENGCDTREAISNELSFLGVEFDSEANDGLRGKLAQISTSESKVKVLVVPTNEELMIARDTKEIVSKL
ncbi:acetate kinase [Clostridium sediminicola]|uniref:acetate kinase n=1 Tax=Clostridium sediminicola TaxID=3114879 RepID=UPI0031F25A75